MNVSECIDKLKDMKGNPWVYKNKVVEILSFADGVGDNGDEYEIYLSDGTTIEGLMINLEKKLNEFKSATGTVAVLAQQKLDQVSTMERSVMCELRDTIMDSIRKLKTDPGQIEQAKGVFQGVNAMIGLAKTELEYRKYLDASANGRRSK